MRVRFPLTAQDLPCQSAMMGSPGVTDGVPFDFFIGFFNPNTIYKPTHGKAVSFALQTSLANRSGLFVVIMLTLCIAF